MRQLLQFTFSGVPSRPGEVAAIFANNARILLAVAVANGVAQAALRADGRGLGRVVMEALVRFCDAVLCASCLIQVALVGAAIGAYGLRALGPILPYLPFELGAFSLILAFYLDARRRRFAPARLAAVTVAGTGLLALGAVVEVYA